MDSFRDFTDALAEYQTTQIPSPRSMHSDINRNTIGLEAALHMVPKTFSGNNQEELEYFLQQCDFVLKCIHNNAKPLFLEKIMVRLTGKARAAVESHTIDTWDGLKKILNYELEPKKITKQLFFELHSIKQKNDEDVATYSERIKSIQTVILKQEISGKSQLRRAAMEANLQAQVIQAFIKGLGTLKEFIQVKNPSSLDEAIQATLEEERTRELFEESKRSCKNPNKERSSNDTETKKLNITCFKCRQTGHFANECRSPQSIMFHGGGGTWTQNVILDVICNYCRKPGHYKRHCSKLQYNILKKEKGLLKTPSNIE